MTKLFDDLVRGGAPAVRALMGRHETLELDFKQRPEKDKDTKRILGKALSAFANSMGGLLVWGVVCRRNGEGVDEVIDFVPVKGLARFASDMRDWTVEALMSRVADIRVEALDEGNDTGFLLIAVERSERRPHHCEFGDKGYYRRAGASSRAMEHFEIEDAFRRASAPELELEAKLGLGGGTRTGATGEIFASVYISLKNPSRISARAAYVATPASYKSSTAPEGVSLRVHGSWRYCEAEQSTIHPGTSRLLAKLQIEAKIFNQGGVWHTPRASLAFHQMIGFGGLDMPKREILVAFEPDDVQQYLNPRPNLVS